MCGTVYTAASQRIWGQTLLLFLPYCIASRCSSVAWSTKTTEQVICVTVYPWGRDGGGRALITAKTICIGWEAKSLNLIKRRIFCSYALSCGSKAAHQTAVSSVAGTPYEFWWVLRPPADCSRFLMSNSKSFHALCRHHKRPIIPVSLKSHGLFGQAEHNTYTIFVQYEFFFKLTEHVVLATVYHNAMCLTWSSVFFFFFTHNHFYWITSLHKPN